MGLYETAKDLAKLVQQIDNIEINKKFMQLQLEMIDAVELISNLKEENIEIREKLKIKDSLNYQDNVYWRINDDNKKSGPFCSRCWDKENNLIHLHKDSNFYRCPVCKTTIVHTETDVSGNNDNFIIW